LHLWGTPVRHRRHWGAVEGEVVGAAGVVLRMNLP